MLGCCVSVDGLFERTYEAAGGRVSRGLDASCSWRRDLFHRFSPQVFPTAGGLVETNHSVKKERSFAAVSRQRVSTCLGARKISSTILFDLSRAFSRRKFPNFVVFSAILLFKAVIVMLLCSYCVSLCIFAFLCLFFFVFVFCVFLVCFLRYIFFRASIFLFSLIFLCFCCLSKLASVFLVN